MDKGVIQCAGTSLTEHDMKRGEITMTVNVHQDWRVRLIWIQHRPSNHWPRRQTEDEADG